MIIADHGAQVIVGEDKRFKAENVRIESLYRNKQHVTLNMKSDQGQEMNGTLNCPVWISVISGFRTCRKFWKIPSSGSERWSLIWRSRRCTQAIHRCAH
jgi:hypothetical protein